MQCIIWKTAAEDLSKLDDPMHYVDSPRAGGKYKLSSFVHHAVLELQTPQKKLLSSWLVRERNAGISAPEITAEVIENLSHFKPLSFTDRVHAALLLLGSSLNITEAILLQPADPTPLALKFLAATECFDIHEAQMLLKLMGEMHWVRVASDSTYMLWPEGWSKFEELQTKLVNSSQAFVAMWFNELTDEVYKNGLYKAIYDCGYDPVRVDKQRHHLNKVDDEIIAEIRRSLFLVADFTCETGKVRGGVYFEAGYAMGLNVPIIWTCKKTSIDDLHFDTRQYPHIPWEDSADLYKQLKDRIGALIGDGPKLHQR